MNKIIYFLFSVGLTAMLIWGAEHPECIGLIIGLIAYLCGVLINLFWALRTRTRARQVAFLTALSLLPLLGFWIAFIILIRGRPISGKQHAHSDRMDQKHPRRRLPTGLHHLHNHPNPSR
ncbi:MAG: hypothetical protein MUO76_09745 [Anaerolineaceae bacterium]|nr:hypothetical protein [Anaerolineaceae bacterium]